MSVMQWVSEKFPDALVADGFDEAVVGVVLRPDQPPTLLYEASRMVHSLTQGDDMDHDMAEEYLQFNTWGAWVGPGTPLYADFRNAMP